MAGNAGFNLTFFDTGMNRGVRASFFSRPGDSWHTPRVMLDLSDYFNRGMLKRIGSVQMFNQYATIGFIDVTTSLPFYANTSTQVSFPLNSLTHQLEIIRFDNLASVTAFELVIYENVIPTFAVFAGLP